MLFVRSLAFQIMFYMTFLAHGLLTPLALLTTRKIAWTIALSWKRSVLFFWRLTLNSKLEVRGLENLPQGGFIVGSKHQSTFETLALGLIMQDVVFILKRELMFFPIFGWFCAKTGMIPINRGKRAKVIGPMIQAAREAIDANRRIIIFMEGTRMAPGTVKPYKVGVGLLYEQLNCPIVPIALNTGLFWPRNSFWHYPGKVVIEILPPILPGLKAIEAIRELETRVEAASNALILETAQSKTPPPTLAPALDRLQERGVNVQDDITNP